jgi:acyl-coenzyme A thioesterase PaaI-like protein
VSSRRQGFLRHVRLPPGLFRRGLNLWPPFLGAGVRVTRVSPDYREVDVTLRLGLFNRNYFGTQFGGSLFAMTDPFFALMMLQNLGPEYVVWDQAGAIRYLRPGRGDVCAQFRLDESAVVRARRATARGGRHEPTFSVDIVDADGETVARVAKTLYVRRRKDQGGPASAPRPAKGGKVARMAR